MNTGESLFAIGALLLLAITTLRVNNNILLTDSMMYDSKFGIIGNSVATSLLERATQENFDEKTISGSVTNTTLLSTLLGKDAGETGPETFDDFDDFNNYTQQDTFYNSLVFHSRCEVSYIDPNSSLDSPAGAQTWHKKIVVYVTWDENNELVGLTQDTIKLSTIYSYWF